MKNYLLFLAAILIAITNSCSTNNNENQQSASNRENRVALAEKFRSESIIVITDEDEQWIGTFDNSRLVDAVFDRIYDGSVIPYDLMDNPMTIEDIKWLESSIDTIYMENVETGELEETIIHEDLQRGDITKIFVKENWYLDEENFNIEKEVINITLATKKYDKSGDMVGYEALFTVYLNGNSPGREN